MARFGEGQQTGEKSSGKQNRKRGAEYHRAVKRAMARAADGKYKLGINLVADQLVKAALDGEQWAIKEVGDRIDGKAKQQVTVTGEDGPLFPRCITIVHE